MTIRPYLAWLACGAVLAALFSAVPASAGFFNPHYIISDQEMRDYRALDYSQILAFLQEKGGFVQCFDVDAIDGMLKSTAQLVDDAAKRYRVNPKYILALIQKESGAVEAIKPTVKQLDWAAGYALCDGCKKTTPLAVKYKGLGKQIDVGAGWMDWYMTNAPTLKNMLQPGQTKVISKTSITPLNLATAALYNYTPHLHGNRLLWSIWNRWFDRGELPPLPDGTLIRNEVTGAVALIQGGKFRPIVSASVLATRFNEANIIDLNEYDFAELQQSNPGRPVKFADLSLVRVEDGTTYLLRGARKRRIISEEVFAKIGFNPEEVEEATTADLEDYVEGEPITLESAYPTGDLLQDKTTGGVYYAESGVKHPVWDKALLWANYSGWQIRPATAATLEALALGEPVKFLDGTLVKSRGAPDVYVISNGQRRPIPSETVFVSYGYDWQDIIETTPAALALQPLGEPLALPEYKATAAEVVK